MPSYRLSAQVISRSNKGSATAAASYRSGEKVRDETFVYSTKAKHQKALNDETVSSRFSQQLAENGIDLSQNASVEKHDNRWHIEDGKSSYTVRERMTGKKNPKPQLSIYENGSHYCPTTGDVKHTEIILPEGAPEWAKNRSDLWTAVEDSEGTREDAQMARELQINLARELTLDQQKTCLREFIQENFTSKGMAADVAIHESDANDGGKNPHAHVMLTLRKMDENGLANNKSRVWNEKELLKEWRKKWADKENEWLEKTDSAERVDHRSYAERGIDQEPGIHMGRSAWHAEQKGIETERGNRQRVIQHNNAVRTLVRNFMADESSGFSLKTIEQINRVANYAIDKTVEFGKSVFEKYALRQMEDIQEEREDKAYER